MKKLIILAALLGVACAQKKTETISLKKIRAAQVQSPYMTQLRQYTFAGRRTGEAYFNAKGDKLIFQSERERGNPFYQIYVKDLTSGQVSRVSNGVGKTTCAWIHPNDRKALYSSTHHDPKSKSLQKAELDFRASGQTRRYAWDYDEEFEIYESSLSGRRLKRLTKARGYDAEASYSPDGKWIAFASNRHAYTEALSDQDKRMFKQNASHMLDIYIMKSDGTGVKRLTRHKGYDGGPFFSPDGRRIVWRRFSQDGHTAEVFTMNVDGSDKRQLTQLKAMSWAPFYHPSGDYIIFTTSLHGHRNFELYAIDTNGNSSPVRVSFMDGFDGLPVFSPDGQNIYWTRKYKNGESQVFTAKWNDLKIRKDLNLAPRFPVKASISDTHSPSDLKNFVYYLASPELKGRMTGSKEEKIYTRNVAQYFETLGLKKWNGSYFQNFPFVEGVLLGPDNWLKDEKSQTEYVFKQDWIPLTQSKNARHKTSKVVFVGYGLDIPETSDFKAYNSYSDTDVKDKWVMMFRHVPEGIKRDKRQHFLRYSKLEHKLTVARNKGAKGVIIVSGPSSKVKSQLVPLRYNESSSESSIGAISVTDDLANRWLALVSKDLGSLQSSLDNGESLKPFTIEGLALGAKTDIQRKNGTARNTLGFVKIPGARKTLIIGAHSDHLGHSPRESSMAKNTDLDQIHYGADDNASGTAALLSLAHKYSQPKNRRGLKQNLLFILWSGEELGTLGSQFFTKNKFNKKSFSAYLNMDMVGRLENKDLSVQGVGSSLEWESIIEKIASQSSVPLKPQVDPYLPTDAMPLYLAGVPVLSFFTGAHPEYHSPRDQAHTLDYVGLSQITHVVDTFIKTIASSSRGPKYNQVTRKRSKGMRGGFRIYLGTIPDYTATKVKGVKLSGVIKGGPAEKAGLKSGDVIVQFSKLKIENIHDYVYSLQSLKPGKSTSLVVIRDGEPKKLNITPASKE